MQTKCSILVWCGDFRIFNVSGRAFGTGHMSNPAEHALFCLISAVCALYFKVEVVANQPGPNFFIFSFRRLATTDFLYKLQPTKDV